MAVSEAHKKASYKYNASRDSITIRPERSKGAAIRRLTDSGSLKKFALMCRFSFRLTRNRSGLSSGSLAVATWYHAETRLSSVEPRNLRFAQKAWNHVMQNTHGTTPTNLV